MRRPEPTGAAAVIPWALKAPGGLIGKMREETYRFFTADGSGSGNFRELEPTVILPASSVAISQPPAAPSSDDRLREAAQNLEAAFLAEMLKSAGLDAQRESFGGGVGEEQFASFLREEQARQMVRAGGLGLAESLYESMKGHVDG